MKLGIVGTGFIVKDLMTTIHEVKNIELVAICSTERSRELGEEIAKANGIQKAYSNYEEFLKDSDVEVVYLGIPNSLHFTYGKQALMADKHVIMEKPFCSNYAQTKKLFELAESRNLMLLEAITTQHNPNYKTIKSLLPEVGDIKIVTLNFSQYSSRYDAFLQGIIKPAFDPKKSGGALMDLNIYNIHYAVGLFGLPDSVQYYPNMDKGIDTSGILMLKYPSFTATLIGAKDNGANSIQSIQGTKGCIYTEAKTSTLDKFYLAYNKKEPVMYSEDGESHRMKQEFTDFERIISEKDYAEVKRLSQISLDVMKVVDLAKASANIVFDDDANI